MNAIWSVIFRYSSIVVQFAVLTVISHRLSPVDYGRYMFALSAVLPTYFIVGAGMSEAGVREIPGLIVGGRWEQAKQFAGVIQTAALASASAAILCAVLGALTQPDPDRAFLVLLIGVYFATNGIVFNCAQILLGWGSERAGAFFFYPAMNLALSLSIIPCVLLSSNPTFPILAAATCGGALFVAMIAIFVVWRTTNTGPNFNLLLFQQQVGLGARLAGARALYSAGLWVPTFVMGVLGSPIEAGVLGTAGRLAAAVAAVNAAVRFSVRPSIARAHRAGDVRSIAKICGVIALATTTLTVLALTADLIWGRQVVELLFGVRLIAAQPITVILLVGILFESIGGPVDEVLKMTGHEMSVLMIFGGGILLLGISCVALARSGSSALAWTQAGYSAIVFATMIVMARLYLGVWMHPTIRWSPT